MHMQRTIAAAALVLSGVLAGCGGDTVVTTPNTTSISQGQELTDLQRALDGGAINQKEYDKLKSVVLKRGK